MKKSLSLLMGVLVFASLVFSQTIRERRYAVALRQTNVRVQPSTDATIAFVAQPGERMELLENLGDWLRVRRKDGTVGYVWVKLVRIEVERIISTAPQPAAVSKKSSNPSSAARKDKKFEINANFHWGSVNPTQFNVDTETLNRLITYWNNNLAGGTVELDQPLEEMKSLKGGDAEVVFYPLKPLGVGIGFSLFSGRKNMTSTTTYTSDFDSSVLQDQYSEDLEAKISAPYMALHFRYPLRIVDINAFVGAGFYTGEFKLNFDHIDFLGRSYYDHLENIKKSTMGFLAGIKIQVCFTGNLGFYLMAKYNRMKFKDMEGDYLSTNYRESGKVYYYEGRHPMLGWLPLVAVFSSVPSEPDMRNAKPAEFDFSGVFWGAGISLRF